jgi:magnesium transporter
MIDVSDSTERLFHLERHEAAAELFQLFGDGARNGPGSRGSKTRIPVWLLVRIAGAIVLAILTSFFKGAFARQAAIVFFVPSVIVLADIAVWQAVCYRIRSYQITAPLGQVDRHRLMSGILAGVLGAVLTGVSALIWLGASSFAAAVAVSLLAASAAGALIGYGAPAALRSCGLDPRIASGPIAAALANGIALAVYFSLSALAIRN